jgi:trans-aconitate methyltransferase
VAPDGRGDPALRRLLVEYTARRKVVDNQFTGNLDDSRWRLITALAKSMAYESEFYDRSLIELKRYRELLAEEWGAGDEIETQSVRVGQDRVDMPFFTGMDSLLSRGRVQDPQ